MRELPEYVPGTAPPGEPALASDAEIAQADAGRKARPIRNRIKMVAERWTKAKLEGLLNASVKKNSDRLHTTEYGNYYRTSTGVDYSAIVWLKSSTDSAVKPWPCVVEVKGVNSGSFPLKNLSTKEIEYLCKGRKHGLAMVSLVWCRDGKVARGFWIPWRLGLPKSGLMEQLGAVDWADLLEYLRAEAKRDKRFKGMSIREKDLTYLDSCELRKVKGRWQPPAWLAPLIPGRGAVQPPMF